MSRLGRYLLTLLVAVLVLPASLEAQQESRFVQDAQRHMALAMTRTDEARQRQDFTRALEPIREGLTHFPESAQLHYLHGQALTGVGEWAEASVAFERALELDPSLAAEIADDQLTAWAGAAQRGLDLLAEGQYEEAVRYLEVANRLRADRPESQLELGRAYINLNRWAEAEAAYRASIDIVEEHGTSPDLTDDDRERFPEYAATARQNLSIVLTQLGAQAFDAGDYEGALARFRESAELAPHSRDHWLNASLAAYNILDDLRQEAATAEGAALAEINRRRIEVGDFMILATERLGTFDPRFQDLYPLALAGYRAKAEAVSDAESEPVRQQMLAIATRHQELDFTVHDVTLQPVENGATVSGAVVFIEGATRAPVQLRISLLNRRGEVVGTETVTVNEATAEQASFQTTIRTEPGAEIIGWRYEVVR
jgi:tetratricopeptide (TPR) repeat protein